MVNPADGRSDLVPTELAPADLVPIDVVARRLGLRASAIRYYEQRGLLGAATQRAGRRWYGPADIRRMAIIRYWQRSGLMTLTEIGAFLSGSSQQQWTDIAQERIRHLRAQIAKMSAACDFLEHVLSHHRGSAPDGCPHYEELLWSDIADG